MSAVTAAPSASTAHLSQWARHATFAARAGTTASVVWMPSTWSFMSELRIHARLVRA